MVNVNDFNLIISPTHGTVLAMEMVDESPPLSYAILVVHQGHAVLWRGGLEVHLHGFVWPPSHLKAATKRLVVVELDKSPLKVLRHIYDAEIEFKEDTPCASQTL